MLSWHQAQLLDVKQISFPPWGLMSSKTRWVGPMQMARTVLATTTTAAAAATATLATAAALLPPSPGRTSFCGSVHGVKKARPTRHFCCIIATIVEMDHWPWAKGAPDAMMDRFLPNVKGQQRRTNSYGSIVDDGQW